MNVPAIIILVSVAVSIEDITAVANNISLSPNIRSYNDESTVKVLSRRKRFLIFPDGSSFQIVFCTQNHGYLQIGNIVWFGTTAALAWELPTDPGDFAMFRDRYKVYEGKRRSDVLYYVDEDGKVVDRIEYKRKILINPAFAKRSVNAARISKKEMHNKQKNKRLFEDLDRTRLEAQRKEKQKLYAKLEKFLRTLGWNGRECILKMLCESVKGTIEQGSFVAEILRAVFTLPVLNPVSEVHKQYDDALGANGDCAELYPKCGDISIV